MSTKDIDFGYAHIMGQIDLFKKAPTVEVGYFNEAIAQYMYFNEVGTFNIPARPVMAHTVESQEATIRALIDSEFIKILDKKSTIKAGLTKVGIKFQGALKRGIIDFNTPPNAAVTVMNKGSNNPLVDTGAAVNSVMFEVTEDG